MPDQRGESVPDISWRPFALERLHMNPYSCLWVGGHILCLNWFFIEISRETQHQRCFGITHLGKTLLGLSLTGGGLGLLMDGSLTLVGGLLRRSLTSGLSSVKQIHLITPQHYLSLKGMRHSNVKSIIKATAIYTFCLGWTTSLHRWGLCLHWKSSSEWTITTKLHLV